MVSQHHPPPSVYFYSTPYSILLQYSHRQHMDHTHTPAKTTRSTSYNNIPFSSYIVPVQSTEYRDTQGNSYPMVPLRPSQGSQLALANHRTEAGRDECLGNIYGRSPYPFFFFFIFVFCHGWAGTCIGDIGVVYWLMCLLLWIGVCILGTYRRMGGQLDATSQISRHGV